MAFRYGFDPSRDIPSLSGKVFLITGGTSGVGKEALLQFAQHGPARIYFTGRNKENGAAVVEAARAIDATVECVHIQCDQNSLASVDAAARTFLTACDRLDVLICNAGIMAQAPGSTADGYEKQFGTNHLAHALLIRRLLPTLRKTAKTHDVRLVALSSGAAQMAFEAIKYDSLKTTQGMMIMGRWRRYGQSKLANLMYANELGRRHPEITVATVHPGVVHATELQTGLPFAHRAFIRATTIGQGLSMEEGAYTTEWVATTAKENLKPGTFYGPVGQVMTQLAQAEDPTACQQLWDWTQAELDQFETRA